MNNSLYERTLRIKGPFSALDLESAVRPHLSSVEMPVRFAVSGSEQGVYDCEIGLLQGNTLPSIFQLEKIGVSGQGKFNVVMVVPTGVGAAIGGHSGDATPAATLLASVCDTLITHPNVLNAADIIQIPPNTLYVEGSAISGLLMGTMGVMPIRSNRLLVVVHSQKDHLFVDAAINSVNAAVATYGLRVSEIVKVDGRFRMTSEFTTIGTAAGKIEGLGYLWDILDNRHGTYDAVAITSTIDVPVEVQREYYDKAGEMVNPWGGVEAILTHAVTLKYGVPAAHAPMSESREIANMDVGLVDPRMAAEVVSVSFLQCVLRGLQKSPRLVFDRDAFSSPSVLTAQDVSCLVIPDGCLGLPTLAALEQGITVISVKENSTVMRNDLASLPWSNGQYHAVDNYFEAAGLIAALRSGINPASIRRPLAHAPIGRNALRDRPMKYDGGNLVSKYDSARID